MTKMRFDSSHSTSLQTAFGSSQPFEWQSSLFGDLASASPPEVLDLPTASGKTFGVIRCWLAAAIDRPLMVPRRLVYVVNRRAVADQVYEDALQISEAAKSGLLHEKITKALKLTDDTAPLSVFAFRGQKPIDQAWQVDPRRLAILVGTPDMLGSRLLFRAYVGSGNWRRAQAAGFIGHDAWWVLDEPHLAEPFWELLQGVKRVQNRKTILRPFWVTAMGATNREVKAVSFSNGVASDTRLQSRLTALKAVRVLGDGLDADGFLKKTTQTIKDHLEKDANCSVAVIVSTVRLAKSIHAELKKKTLPGSPEVYSITGAMRGHDRDRVMEAENFRSSFLSGSRPRSRASILVGTQCLEAGFDGDFDLLISDIPNIPSVIQRLGRLNRIGATDESNAYFIRVRGGEPKQDKISSESLSWLLGPSQEEWCQLSGSWRQDRPSILERWKHSDSNTRARLSEPPVACPKFGNFEALAFAASTEMNGSSRARTELFINGIESPDQGEVLFVWRNETRFLPQGSLAVEALRFRPPVPAEMAQLSAGAAREFLVALAKRLAGKDSVIWKSCVVVSRDLQSWGPLFELNKGKLTPASAISGRIIVLHPMAGGYEGSFLEAACEGEVGEIRDICGDPLRNPITMIWDGSSFIQPVAGAHAKPPSADDDYASKIPAGCVFGEKSRGFFEKSGWAVFHRARAVSQKNSAQVSLNEHTEDVCRLVASLAESFELPEHMIETLRCAALWHDSGKSHHSFQRYLGNHDLSKPVAKSGRRGGGRSPFRHEALSLLQAETNDELAKALIGSHHGYGRPLFPADSLPPRIGAASLGEADGESLSRFAHLHEAYSPWAIAWLESLLKSADAQASAASEGNEEI